MSTLLYKPNTRVVFSILTKNGILRNHEEYSDPVKIFNAVECILSTKSKILSIDSKIYNDGVNQNDSVVYLYFTTDNTWDAVRFSEKRYAKQIKDLSVIRNLNSNKLRVDNNTIQLLSSIVSIVAQYDSNNKLITNALKV